MENLIEFNKEGLIKELKELHRELVQVYSKLFMDKYSNQNSFKEFVDKEYKENGISGKDKKEWNEKFCHKASYTLINKILFIKICEDRDFMISDEDRYTTGDIKDAYAGKKLSHIGYQKWTNLITNYTLSELLQLAFRDMSVSYPNIVLYKKDKYEQLNPTKEEIEKKFKCTEFLYKETSSYQFETILNDVIYRLDKPEYNFRLDVQGNVLGDVYEKFLDRQTRKALGQFYTPDFVIDYILKNTVEEVDVKENPFVRILDPSCGSGHFLISAYNLLRKKFEDNLFALKERYAEEEYDIKVKGIFKKVKGIDYWKKENIHYHILKYCIFGADIDDFAIQLTTINLLLKDLNNITDELNIIQCDSLVRWEEDYNWNELKKQLNEEYIIEKHISKDLFGNEIISEHKVTRDTYVIKYRNLLGLDDKEVLNKVEAEELLKKCEFWSNSFDYIIGNPPYIGHKDLTKPYKEFLRKFYNEIFSDKSDISYCFIYRFMHKKFLNKKISFITSRYFLESVTGLNLRRYIKNNIKIDSILDFYGVRILEDIGVDSVIFSLDNNVSVNDDSAINVTKINIDAKNINEEELFEIIINNAKHFAFEKFIINQNKLRDAGWMLVPDNIMKLINKIENRCQLTLDDICDSYQGIITGRDRAFIVTPEIINSEKIELNLIKPWIKNSYVKKYNITKENLYIIYSNSISNIQEYPNAIRFISYEKEKLMNRRECINGLRKWYELQWGRVQDIFDGEKVIFPYKASSNRFALDSGSYYSADVYAIVIKQDKKQLISYYDLLGILNSRIYEVYFKSFAKKLGDNLYDYYPNTVMRLNMPTNFEKNKVGDYVKSIIEEYNKITSNTIEFLEFKNSNLILEKYLEEEDKKIRGKININRLENLIESILIENFDFDSEDVDVINQCFMKVKKKIEVTPSKLIEEIKSKNKSLEQISESYGYNFEEIVLLRDSIIEKYYSEDRWKLYDLSGLYNAIECYIVGQVVEILQQNKKYLMLEEICDLIAHKCNNFDELMKVMRIEDPSKTSIDIIKNCLNLSSDNWNIYFKNSNENKIQNKIVKYENDVYGLSVWNDEVHKEYFLNIINEYTVNKPNKKKAENVLKILMDLNIEYKEAYVDEIEKSIKKLCS